MLGTKWVAPGEGAEAVDLIDNILCLNEQAARSDNGKLALANLFALGRERGQHHSTNLALTGEPLTDYDLRRIAVCE